MPEVYARDGTPVSSDSALAHLVNRNMRATETHIKTVTTAPEQHNQTVSYNRSLARLTTQAPRIPWDLFKRDYFKWRPGEHVGMIGPTGQGKTTMLVNILPFHPYVTVFATKPRDETMEYLVTHGYIVLDKWKSIDPKNYPRRVIWPDARKLNSHQTQRKIFTEAFSKIYREGGWTLALDETWYFINTLKLDHPVKTFLLQARSLGISLVAATQRPSMVPLEIYDQSTWLFFWRDNDEQNLKRIAGLSVHSAGLIKSIVSSLERYQVLVINTRTGEMIRTRCPKVEGI